MQCFFRVLSLFVLCSLAAANVSVAEEWPQFLGPQRNGISLEKGLLEKWPSEGPDELWRVPGGIGMAGLVIRDGKLLTMVQHEGQQKLIALDAKSGEPLWSTDIAPAYRNQMGDGPRATPTISGDRVFVFTGEGILAALKFDDGELLWSHNVPKELKGEPAEYGMACSPLVVGNQVVVTAGAPQAAVVSYRVDSGKLAWKVGDGLAGYSSPALLTVGGKEQIVAFTGSAVLGIAPLNGAALWQFLYETEFGCNIATPLAYKDQVFVSAGENHGSVLLAVKSETKGQQASEVWASLGAKSVLRNEWQTSILLGDHLYGFDNVGGAGPVSHLTCINAATGERMWQKVRFGKGNMISAGSKLWIVTIGGELVLANASPQKFEELGRKSVVGQTRQAPALANGFLYLRDDKEIVCLDVRKH